MDGLATHGCRSRKRTDYKPSDVDTAQLYDGFSFQAVAWLESLGFCDVGEGGRFIEGGKRIALDGELPSYTFGGNSAPVVCTGLALPTKRWCNCGAWEARARFRVIRVLLSQCASRRRSPRHGPAAGAGLRACARLPRFTPPGSCRVSGGVFV